MTQLVCPHLSLVEVSLKCNFKYVTLKTQAITLTF
jgi:hypothetical protein